MSANDATQGLGKFIQLIQDFNVIGFALGVMIGNNISELANAAIDGIIMPTLKPILDKIQGKNASFELGGIKMDLGKFISALIKFLALAVVIYVMMLGGVNISKPVSWVSVRSVAEGVSL
jgi:large conductance mechanosensitive channel